MFDDVVETPESGMPAAPLAGPWSDRSTAHFVWQAARTLEASVAASTGADSIRRARALVANAEALVGALNGAGMTWERRPAHLGNWQAALAELERILP